LQIKLVVDGNGQRMGFLDQVTLGIGGADIPRQPGVSLTVELGMAAMNSLISRKQFNYI